MNNLDILSTNELQSIVGGDAGKCLSGTVVGGVGCILTGAGLGAKTKNVYVIGGLGILGGIGGAIAGASQTCF